MSQSKPWERKKARSFALQALYQWQVGQQSITDIEHQFLCEQKMGRTDINYFRELVKEIPTQVSRIDEEFSAFISRELNEISPIELATLRIATYEFLQHQEIPYRVIINEAVELAKKFGATESHKFINSVVDRVAHKVRATEIAGEKSKSNG